MTAAAMQLGSETPNGSADLRNDAQLTLAGSDEGAGVLRATLREER